MTSAIRGKGISPEDPSLPDNVRKRWKILDARAVERAESIHKAIGQEQLNQLSTRMQALAMDCNSPPRLRLRELYKVANEMMSYTTGFVACKRGCSHCCHIAVPISPIEADLIGADIGMRRRVVPLRQSSEEQAAFANTFSYGYTRPCAFLVNNACSIYKNRPLACRIHYNVDDDDLLCRLDHPGPIPVPYLDVTPFYLAYIAITGTKMADVREFFPRGIHRRQRS